MVDYGKWMIDWFLFAVMWCGRQKLSDCDYSCLVTHIQRTTLVSSQTFLALYCKCHAIITWYSIIMSDLLKWKCSSLRGWRPIKTKHKIKLDYRNERWKSQKLKVKMNPNVDTPWNSLINCGKTLAACPSFYITVLIKKPLIIWADLIR